MNSHRIRAASCSKVDLSPIQNVFIVPWKCIYLEKSHYLPNVSFWPIRVTIILLRVGLAWETSALLWSVEKTSCDFDRSSAQNSAKWAVKMSDSPNKGMMNLIKPLKENSFRWEKDYHWDFLREKRNRVNSIIIHSL